MQRTTNLQEKIQQIEKELAQAYKKLKKRPKNQDPQERRKIQKEIKNCF